MAKKQNIALGKIGMDSDTHPSGLNETQYTYAKNLNLENESGNTLNASSEHSNILATKFKEGFKVIHAVNDIDTTNTYFFLVNPTTGVGEFGFVENNQTTNDLEDLLIDCDECHKIKQLAEPLETINQVALQTYTTLISDECHVLAETPEKGFNFTISNPIKKSVIKNEKCGKTIYFAHKGNPPRHINIDKINEYFIQEVPCEDDVILSCPNFDKMRIFKLFNIPEIEPASIELGGNLKMGVYEFLISYCNTNGQEITEYYSLTNPISIFDENNKIIDSSKISERTNYSIKLDIKNIDKNYEYYKIAVIQTADIEGTSSVFEVGVFPTSMSNIKYSTELNKKRLSFDDVFKSFLFIEEAEGVATANNILYQYGITNEKELNLQPVINLLGEVGVKWQTHIASEDLYKDGINCAKYLGYNREEVVPFSIRFNMIGGKQTPYYPLISRQPNEYDLEIINEANQDRLSVENSNDCIVTNRSNRWKLYNTATEDGGFCSGSGIETVEVTETENRFCIINDIAVIPQGNAVISLESDFSSFTDYVNTNQGNSLSECSDIFETTTQNVCSYLFADYSAITCPYVQIDIRELTNSGNSGTVFVNINNVEYAIVFNTNIQTTINNFIATNSASLLSVTGEIPYLYLNSIAFKNSTPIISVVNSNGNITANIQQLFDNNCSLPQIVNSKIIISNVENEKTEKVEKVFPTEYVRIYPSKTPCQIHGSETVQDSNNPLGYEIYFDGFTFPPTCHTRLIPVYKRTESVNTTCNLSKDIVLNTDFTNNYAESIFFNYYYSNTISDLYPGSKTSNLYTDSLNFFPNVLNLSALWFKGTTDSKNKFLIEISKQKLSDVNDSMGISNHIRMTIYSKCSSTTHLYSDIIDVSTGSLHLIEKQGIKDLKITNPAGTVTVIPNGWFSSGNFYVALDCPIRTKTVIFRNDSNVDNCDIYTVDRNFIVPTQGCITLTKRDVEYSGFKIYWDSIRLAKEIEYSSECTYNQPIVKRCDAIPYKKGNFSFWQSTDRYSDNDELYNSSNLNIYPEDIPVNIRGVFESRFTTNSVGKYIWKNSQKFEGDNTSNSPVVDYTCRNIRHFKFPSNKVAPFMWENVKTPFSSSPIFPLGITIDEEYLKALLNIAQKNNIISKKERESIVGYEIARGDMSVNRSILSSGLLFDMRNYYDENGVNILYPNYPYNSYNNDTLNNIPLLNEFGIKNNNFTFHSPETDYKRFTLPSEMSIQGYMYGNSSGYFNEVKEHPKYVILSNSARNLASTLAVLETVSEIVIQSAMAYSNAQIWVVAGVGSSGFSAGLPALIAAGVIAALGTISGVVFKYGRYRYEWLETFRNLGQPKNFAYYYYSNGFYNYLGNNQEEGNMLRNLNISSFINDNVLIKTNEVTGVKNIINNKFREESVFLSTGNYKLSFPNTYLNYDNGSLTYASENGDSSIGKSKEIIKKIASPYVQLKNYVENQHGTIESISWINTGFTGDLTKQSNSCLAIFGGDTYISRHSLKRKHAQFSESAMGGADREPFNYYFYNNIGRNPRFYLSYGINKDFEGGGKLFPDIEDDFEMDSTIKDGNYYVPPSKFYLYYYGVPNFLCESRINTNFRYGGNKIEERSPETAGDLGDWTQESKVSIREKNWFFYNDTYSKLKTKFKTLTLPSNYKKENNNCKADFPNGIISSLPDNSENNDYDPWLIYRPLDFFEFSSQYGKLKDVQGIENEAILTRFENTSILWNKVDYTNDDGQNPNKPFLGGTSVFQRRSASFYNAQLGFGGTQNTASISCEFGHFHVDAMRGQVIQTQPSGGQMEEISSIINGKPSGKRNWFKEHLPFKIKKYFKNVDVDNNYNGVGISMGWDSRYRRVFITKKDYVPKNQNITHSNGKFYLAENEVNLLDSTYFEDVSWTIAYSPVLGTWMSFYDFHPNYYVSHNNYFQTGINSNDSKNGLWSHLLTNKSYFVFYGDKYSFDIEIPLKSENVTKKLEAVTLWTEAIRYENTYDINVDNTITFNKSLIWNNIGCSGQLNLIPQKNNLKDNKNYPKTNSDNTQDILISNKDNFQWNYNYFFDRVKTTPFLINDKNQINRTVNSSAIAFSGSRVLKRLEGDWFLNRLSYNKDSRYKLMLKFMITTSEV